MTKTSSAQGAAMPPTDDARYPADTDSAVRYFPVSRAGEVIGYLWAAETDDAISFLRRVFADQDTLSASWSWSQRIREAKGKGLTPLQALHHWVGHPEDAKAGHIPDGTLEGRAASLGEVWDLANPGYVEEEFDYDEALAPRTAGWDRSAPMSLNQPGYRHHADGPVRYVPVILAGRLLGHLWASDDEAAASFLPRTAAGTSGHEALAPWFIRLITAKNEGLSPYQALRRWVGASEDPVAGAIPADAEERIAPSLTELADTTGNES